MAKSVRTILFLAANPRATSRLSLDEEAEEIRKGLERSRWRESFAIETRWAVNADELRRSLLDIDPHIVHFSGHGTGTDGLVLHASGGKAKLAGSEALAKLFSLFAGKIECVLLNACYSKVQAEAIHRHVDCVIGMNQSVSDRAATTFAVGFYDALGAGRAYENAYQFGCSAIDFESVELSVAPPVLMVRKSVRADATDEPSVETVEASELTEPTAPTAPTAPTNVILENPEGQVPLVSPFYVARSPIETDCYAEIENPGALIRVKAARQMGKSSLMSRILDHGSQKGYRSVPIYFQEADGEVFEDLEKFLRWFCAIIAEELDLDIPLDTIWQPVDLGHKRKCTNFLQKHVLPAIKTPLVLGLDEVDLIFQHLEIAQDFFALLRTWHERGRTQATWQNLRLVIVHSREVYIPLDMNQSPFNVGMPVELPEFTAQQVRDSAQRHGLSLSAQDLANLLAMVGGHPYLVRMALYELARKRLSLAELLAIAPTEEGPYAEHLRRHLANLHSNDKLVKAVEEIINSPGPVAIGNDESFHLASMGLVRRKGNSAELLCDLYRQYFRERL